MRIWLKLTPLALAPLLLASGAQGAALHRPFAVGNEEASGAADGITGWLLNAQSYLTHLMSSHVRSLSSDPSSLWALLALGFVYGVLHAAGPGHGKAVVASYMMANVRALRRGVVLAFLAAALQGLVAVLLVGVGALILSATSKTMNMVADNISVASYLGVAILGAWLVWKKGRALASTISQRQFLHKALESSSVIVGATWRPIAPARANARFRALSPSRDILGSDECAHVHAPDPRTLDERFSFRAATATVFAAGSRPCSGAILVLVFALTQNVFFAGVLATFAISMGTAMTTGVLAILAVFAKNLAIRLTSAEGAWSEPVARVVELVAAICVFAIGLGLLLGRRSGV